MPIILSVPGPADLCTLEEARSFLQKATGQTGTDDILQTLITNASAAIIRAIDIEVLPNETAEAKTLEWDGCLRVSLTPYVARSVTAVTCDPGEASETALSSADWRLAPEPARDGVYYRLLLSPIPIPPYTGNFPSRRIRVTGEWGFETVPDTLKHACLLTVIAWYRSRVAGFSTSYEDADGGPDARTDLIPRDAFRLLDQWRRMEV